MVTQQGDQKSRTQNETRLNPTPKARAYHNRTNQETQRRDDQGRAEHIEVFLNSEFRVFRQSWKRLTRSEIRVRIPV